MLTSEEIVPALERILADQAVFISKLQGITPGIMTHAKLHEMEEEVHESFELLKEMIPAVAELQPDPVIIGDRLNRALKNVIMILEELTPLYQHAPE
jgi:hypothetical protein